ncbi:hypothetical protein MRX96_038867 [Rhipicephalus microplus]
MSKKSGEKETGPVEAPLTASKKLAPRADTPVQAPKRVQVQIKKEEARPSTSNQGTQPAAPLSPRWREGASHTSCQGSREVPSSSQARWQPSTGSGGREGKVNVRVRF